jgi:23S rRNA A2030 N6-methylase RlmJ
MGIYIEDSKTHTVRHYCTSPKIEKAIETLLRSDDALVYSETHPGYVVTLTDESEDNADECNL